MRNRLHSSLERIRMKRQLLSSVPKLLRVSEAARYFGVSRNFIQRLLDGGDLPCIRLDDYKIRIAKSDLDKWVRKNRAIYKRAEARNKRLGKRPRPREHDIRQP